jgi:hypothetical protein
MLAVRIGQLTAWGLPPHKIRSLAGRSPDVISARLSQDAWAVIPAGRQVHLPVSSLTSSAFPKSLRKVGFPHQSAERLEFISIKSSAAKGKTNPE